MTRPRIKAILFDLGDTLLDFGEVNLPRLFMEGAKRAHAYLQGLGQPTQGFRHYRDRHLMAIRWNVAKAWLLRREFHAGQLMRRLCRKQGMDLTDEQVSQLCWLWYEPLHERATVEEGLREMLAGLRDRGLKLGVVSNTFIPGEVLDRHLAEEGLLEYLPQRVYSCDVGVRKPHRRIFRVAAERIGTAPSATLFCGDSPRADIYGARRAGMQTLLKDPLDQHENTRHRPHYRVRHIVDLPQAVGLDEGGTGPGP